MSFTLDGMDAKPKLSTSKPADHETPFVFEKNKRLPVIVSTMETIVSSRMAIVGWETDASLGRGAGDSGDNDWGKKPVRNPWAGKKE
jgi:hypothetical protein